MTQTIPTRGLVTIAHLERTFAGKIVRITHAGNASLKNAVGVCRAFHPIDTGVDIELTDGSRYAFIPVAFTNTEVVGDVGPWIKGLRKVEIVGTADDGSYELTKGPSREELFDALRLHSEGRVVTFTVEGCLQFTAIVYGIDVDYSASNSWTLRLRDKKSTLGGLLLTATYRTDKRRGRVSIS